LELFQNVIGVRFFLRHSVVHNYVFQPAHFSDASQASLKSKLLEVVFGPVERGRRGKFSLDLTTFRGPPSLKNIKYIRMHYFEK